MPNAYTLALGLASVGLSLLSLVIGSAALIFVIALKNSTHQVTYLDPLASLKRDAETPDIPPLTEDQKKAFSKMEFENLV
jgi:hypothetical protein